MKQPTFAPAYVGLFPILAEAAHEQGYALAVHGSVVRDFDLVAIPWIDQASDAETLVRTIVAKMNWRLDGLDVDRLFFPPYVEAKPHGRKAFCIPLDSGAAIDLSVIPRLRDSARFAREDRDRTKLFGS